MDYTKSVLHLMRATGALLEGHFILRSGLHSRQFFQCARLFERPDCTIPVATWMIQRLQENPQRRYQVDTVISPAMGGLQIGYEVARQLNRRFIFTEKDGTGKLALRRDFKIQQGERFLLVEDVITRGGRIQETIDIVKEHGGEVTAVTVVVDRSGGNRSPFTEPLLSLIEVNVETFEADKLPEDLQKIPAVKPGSK